MPDPFIILGDSHVTAFLAGAREAGAGDLVKGGGWGNGRIFFDRFFDCGEDGKIEIYSDRTHYDKWRRKVGRDINACTGQLIVSMGLSATSLYNSPMWQTFGPGGMPVSEGLLGSIIADMHEQVIEFYRALKARGLIAAAYAPPPPQRKHPAFDALGEAFVWNLVERYQMPMLAVLEEESIPLIRLPIADEDGYLKPEFAGPDPAHANASIGPYVAEALRELASKA